MSSLIKTNICEITDLQCKEAGESKTPIVKISVKTVTGEKAKINVNLNLYDQEEIRKLFENLLFVGSHNDFSEPVQEKRVEGFKLSSNNLVEAELEEKTFTNKEGKEIRFFNVVSVGNFKLKSDTYNIPKERFVVAFGSKLDGIGGDTKAPF